LRRLSGSAALGCGACRVDVSSPIQPLKHSKYIRSEVGEERKRELE
jgi:hypothetical protein